MRKLILTAIVAASAMTFVPAANAAAPTTDAPRCRFASATDPQVEGSQTGFIQGGPIVIGAQTGYMTCTIQVNQPLHSGADACVVEGDEMTGVVYVAGPCTYASGLLDNVYLCTQVTITAPVSETWYWDDEGGTPATGHWSQNPDSHCVLATSIVTPDLAFLDEIICPVLEMLFPGGDIVLPEPIGLFWDCPPYEDA